MAAETIALIRSMTTNTVWGTECICGEILKLNVRVVKSTVQKYIRHARSPRRAD